MLFSHPHVLFIQILTIIFKTFYCKMWKILVTCVVLRILTRIHTWYCIGRSRKPLLCCFPSTQHNTCNLTVTYNFYQFYKFSVSIFTNFISQYMFFMTFGTSFTLCRVCTTPHAFLSLYRNFWTKLLHRIRAGRDSYSLQ